MSNYVTASGLEKASVLLLSLGVDNSSKVLQYLGESEIERVLMSLSKASSIPPEIRSIALQERGYISCLISLKTDNHEMIIRFSIFTIENEIYRISQK